MTRTLPWQNRQDTDSSSFSSSFSLDAIARPLIVFHVPSANGSSSWILERLVLAATVAFSLFCTVAQKCHGNFNFTTAISTSFTAISTLSRQFQFHHGNFNFVHGNFNFVTAISISPRQFQLCSRQFQLHHGNFNFTTTISILSRQFQLRSRQFQFQFHHRESTKVVKKK